MARSGSHRQDVRNSDRTITVVGIARNSKYRSLGEDPRNFIYLPLAQRYHTRLSLLVRTRSAPQSVVALLLALLGIYGVTAFSVAQRTREIGVRMALGAQRGSVIQLILRQGLVLAVIGVGVGAALAFGVTRLLRVLLYGISTTDLVSFGGAAVLLVLAALAASWIPAMRAATVDPVVALRAD